MQTRPVYQVLAEDIRGLGIDIVFGLISDDIALFVAALDSIGVRYCAARHENMAIAMAEGYASATGGVAIAAIGRGPATANGLHAAVYASRTGSKVLIITGEQSAAAGPNRPGPDYKGLNAAGVLSAAGLPTFSVTSAETARQTLADALDAAQHGKTAVLLLPASVQTAEIGVTEGTPGPAQIRKSPLPAPANPQSIQSAAMILSASKRPLIMAGLGAHRAGAAASLKELADTIGAALITSLKAKDMFRGHPFNAGILGSFSHAAGRSFVEEADCILVFGASLNLWTMSFGHSIPAGIPIIQVDRIRANIGRWSPADLAIVGDARQVAEQLTSAMTARAKADKPFHSETYRRRLAEHQAGVDFQPAHTARTVDPRALALELDRLLPQQRNLIYDAGNFLQVAPYLSVPGPDCLKLTSDFASIGLSFGVAMGVARAKPDMPTVLVIGDGGLLMTLGELETVIREDIPLVIVLMNDAAYGAELHYLKMNDMPVAKSVFADVDFAPVAEAFGFQAFTIRALSDLQPLADLLARPEGPIFLDCKINPAVAAPFMGELVEAGKKLQR